MTDLERFYECLRDVLEEYPRTATGSEAAEKEAVRSVLRAVSRACERQSETQKGNDP